MAINFGTQLKRLREAADMTQADLADALRVRPETISKWENGHYPPNPTAIRRLATVFGLDGVTVTKAVMGTGRLPASPPNGLPSRPSSAGESAVDALAETVERQAESLEQQQAQLAQLTAELEQLTVRFALVERLLSAQLLPQAQ